MGGVEDTVHMQEIRIYEEQSYNWKKLQVKIRKLGYTGM